MATLQKFDLIEQTGCRIRNRRLKINKVRLVFDKEYFTFDQCY